MKRITFEKLLVTIILILSLLFGIGVFNIHLNEVEYTKVSNSVIEGDKVIIEEKKKEPIIDFEFAWTNKEWQDNYEINNDYVGDLRFESGLIDLPVVQGYDNEIYLASDWVTGEYLEQGTAFVDYEVIYKDSDIQQEDLNITIYGHYCYPSIDPEQKLAFTPLKNLVSEDVYKENKYIQLLLGDEIRRYEIAEVFYCDLISDESGKYVYTRDDMQYYLTSFTKEYLEEYKRQIAERRFYETGVSYDESSHLLTLQTCVADHDELRLIIIAKEIERIKLEK